MSCPVRDDEPRACGGGGDTVGASERTDPAGEGTVTQIGSTARNGTDDQDLVGTADRSPAVALRGLVKRFAAVTAVDGVHRTTRPGEVVALLGPNGAGKSTTIDMLLGLLRPDEGQVLLYGGDPRTAIESGRVGALLQSGGLLPDRPVAETVALLTGLHRHPRPVAELLERADLTELAGRRVGTLSGGQ